MNINYLISRLSAVCCAIGLAACAAPPPKVIVPFQPSSSPIRSVEIVLYKPQFVPSGEALNVLNHRGWNTGVLERNFCDGLVARFKEVHVDAWCVKSLWGKRVPFFNVPSQPSTHVITIEPLNLRYQVSKTNYGTVISAGTDPSMETLTEITEIKTNKIVWSGNVDIRFFINDSDGTKSYSQSLLGSLKSFSAITNK